jgi:hypothetical protein
MFTKYKQIIKQTKQTCQMTLPSFRSIRLWMAEKLKFCKTAFFKILPVFCLFVYKM